MPATPTQPDAATGHHRGASVPLRAQRRLSPDHASAATWAHPIGEADLARLLRPAALTFKSYVETIGPFPQDDPAGFLAWLSDQLSIPLPPIAGRVAPALRLAGGTAVRHGAHVRRPGPGDRDLQRHVGPRQHRGARRRHRRAGRATPSSPASSGSGASSAACAGLRHAAGHAGGDGPHGALRHAPARLGGRQRRLLHHALLGHAGPHPHPRRPHLPPGPARAGSSAACSTRSWPGPTSAWPTPRYVDDTLARLRECRAPAGPSCCWAGWRNCTPSPLGEPSRPPAGQPGGHRRRDERAVPLHAGADPRRPARRLRRRAVSDVYGMAEANWAAFECPQRQLPHPALGLRGGHRRRRPDRPGPEASGLLAFFDPIGRRSS